MTLMRVQCPVCEAACLVPDTTVAGASRTRCEICGLLFTPMAANQAGDAPPREKPEVRPEPASPQPPSVIYTTSVPGAAGPAAGVARPAVPRSPATGSPPGAAQPTRRLYAPKPGRAVFETAPVAPQSSPASHPGNGESPQRSAPDTVFTSPAIPTRNDEPHQWNAPDTAPVSPMTHAGTSEATQRSGEPGRPNSVTDGAAGALGPPPPYRPIVAAPRPAPPRVEMAPAPPAAPVNIRVIGALGPPPPYRPVIQAAPVFGRGPAPDLEPWRLASLTRLPALRPEPAPEEAGGEPLEDEWALSREPEPEVGTPPPVEDSRLEVPEDFGPRDRPLVWPPGSQAPHMLPASVYASRVAGLGPGPGIAARGREIRRMLWVVGIGMAVLGLGITLHIGRERVMRAFPAAVRIYGALGLATAESSAAPDQDTAPLGAGCAEESEPEQTKPQDARSAGCEASQSATPTK